MNKNRIYTLDIVRIVLMLIIFLFHMRLHTGFGINFIPGFNNFISIGNISMVGFFILSGYVLFYGNYDIDFNNIADIIKYVKKRIINLFPLYLFIFAYCLYRKVGVIEGINTLLILPIELLGLSSLFPEILGSYGNSGTWFVSVIFILYLIFPFIKKIIKDLEFKKCIFLIILLYIFCTYVTIFQSYINTNVYANPLFRMFEFIIGMLVARIYIYNSSKKEKEHCAFTIIKILMVSLIYYFIVNYFYNKLFFNGKVFCSSPTFYNIFSIPFYSYIIYLFTKLNNKNNIISKISRSRVITYLSTISYSFYQVQMITFIELKVYFVNHDLFNKFSMLSTFLIFFSVNLVLAFMLHEIIEKPILKKLKKENK